MVQDTSSSPEMYLAKLPQGRPGGWGLESTIPESGSQNIDYADLRECTTFWAVSIPGESQWCAHELDDTAPGEILRYVHHVTFQADYLKRSYNLERIAWDVQPTTQISIGRYASSRRAVEGGSPWSTLKYVKR
jgi:hypothetical protein